VTTFPGTFLGAVGPVALAHRGFSAGAAAGRAAESSMAAFAAAVDLGYRYLETDVHATADGVLVAFHDATLDRATDARGAIADLPWSVVAAARIGGSEPVARLEEVLAAWPQVRLNIDVKHPAAVAPLVRVLTAAGVAERVCVASFSDARRRAVVAGLRERGLAVASSAGRGGVLRFLAAARAGLRGRALRAVVAADCLQVPERSGPVRVVTPAALAAAHGAGMPVHVWTVDEAADMRRLLDAGVDGLVTDRADVLREVLRERGQWPSAVAGPDPGPDLGPGVAA
jgi:glycerophosphoryl diester phosphodiesterase